MDVKKDATVPPEKPPRKRNAVVDSPRGRKSPFGSVPADFNVLFERYTDTSEGIESKPHDGTMTAPVFVAR